MWLAPCAGRVLAWCSRLARASAAVSSSTASCPARRALLCRRVQLHAQRCHDCREHGNSFADSGGWRALRDAAVAEKGLPQGSPVDGRRVFEWIADGDKAAQRALDRYARAFDGQLINLQAVLDPEVFVIAGGISGDPELVDALRAQMPLASRVTQAPCRHSCAADKGGRARQRRQPLRCCPGGHAPAVARAKRGCQKR